MTRFKLMNIYKKLGVATAGAALSFATIEVYHINPVQAATVTYDFTVDVTTGSLAGTKSLGSFSYDDSTLTGRGLETLDVNQGLSVSFDFLGRTYRETDDFDSPIFPVVEFQDKSLLGISYAVVQQTGFGFQFTTSDPDVSGGNEFVYGNFIINFKDGDGVVTYSLRSVPEPSGMSGLAVLGLGLLLKRKTITTV